MIAGRKFWLWRAVDDKARFSISRYNDGAIRLQR
jgi:hypothetical protein